jgi:hypothetical protein
MKLPILEKRLGKDNRKKLTLFIDRVVHERLKRLSLENSTSMTRIIECLVRSCDVINDEAPDQAPAPCTR